MIRGRAVLPLPVSRPDMTQLIYCFNPEIVQNLAGIHYGSYHPLYLMSPPGPLPTAPRYIVSQRAHVICCAEPPDYISARGFGAAIRLGGSENWLRVGERMEGDVWGGVYIVSSDWFSV